MRTHSCSPSATDALDRLEQFLLIAPVLLFSMVAHEYAHGYAAMKQGDMTARDLGRLTWNPAKHIDPFMTVMLPLMLWAAGAKILGGAKPIPVNPANYRHYKRGDIIVSLAGIVTNFGIAIVCLPLIVLVGMLGAAAPALVKPLGIFQLMLEQGIFLNLLLALFNLLPIPPLDGSHVFKYLLPRSLAVLYQRISTLGFLLVFALLYFGGGFLNWWFTPIALLAQRFEALYSPYMLMPNSLVP